MHEYLIKFNALINCFAHVFKQIRAVFMHYSFKVGFNGDRGFVLQLRQWFNKCLSVFLA